MQALTVGITIYPIVSGSRGDRELSTLKARPTLQDVSRLARVSTATVSRVLNEPDRVRSDTRAQVEAAIAELGYAPHFGARALASNRTSTIGAIIPTMENAIFARGIQALQEELAGAAYTLLVATSNYDADREFQQIQALIGRGVDGLVLIGEERPASVYQMLQERAVPFVLVWAWRADAAYPSIGFDNRASAVEIADHVLDLGHRRVGMIAGLTDGNDRARLRVAGVRDAMAARGMLLRDDQLIQAPYTMADGAAAAHQLLAMPDRPTALICGNDVLAIGALAAARDLGLSVPDQVSVTGFDNIELSSAVTPALTTVHVPHRRMGQTAGARLLAHCRAGEALTGAAFETHIVERGSVGPPPR